MKRIFSVLILVVIIGGAVAQKQTRREARAERKAQTQRMVDSLLTAHEFMFYAQRVVTSLPEKPYITLSGADFVKVGKDGLRSALPFYGQLYSAPMPGSDSPLSFSSESFTYQTLVENNKKNLIQLNVKTSNTIGNYTIVFEVFSDGTAVANITMARGSSSMFFGYIVPIETKKK